MLLLLRWLSRRSLRSLHALGAFLGWMAYALSPSYRRRLRSNAQRAGITLRQRRQSVAEAGKMATEGLRLWLRPSDMPIADPVQWEGQSLIEDALDQGRGLVFLTPHLGSFEITAQAYAQRYGARRPITVMFRPARHPMLRELQESARARPALATAPASIGGVRQMMRALQRGEAVGLLPDQVPPQGMGVWADFFGAPAYTMTLAARLALQSGAPIVLAWCERLPAGRGFHLRLSRLAEPLPLQADDAEALQVAQAGVINRAMQQLILQCPQQYLWGYNRYKRPRRAAPAATAPQP
ncbi:MAG: lysophospholipid acyltransferase family protein [Burkholderiaceae bacterium]|jgi:KDO2-lipid IV(A) lauroyltransferase|nr:lysophospholipid acyltransferase family protein [Burkholderiaceae bacterium]